MLPAGFASAFLLTDPCCFLPAAGFLLAVFSYNIYEYMKKKNEKTNKQMNEKMNTKNAVHVTDAIVAQKRYR